MKYPGVVLIFFSMVLGAVAQNNPSLEATNVVVGGKPMSLQDCIQESLNHNFDVQIQRYGPQISLYALYADYAVFDPVFNLTGTHNYNVQPPSLNSDNMVIPSASTKSDTFDSSLSGVLPFTGLQYDFSGTIDQRNGTGFIGTTNIIPEPFQNSAGSVQVQLTQPLLQNFWIDKSRLTIKLGKNQLQSSEQGFRSQVITSVTAVETAYYELIYALENLKVQKEALALSQTQLDQDRQRLAIGTVALLSVQQDQSQVAQNLSTVISAQATLEKDQNTLKTLITDNYPRWHDTDIQPTETLTAPLVLFNLQDSWSRGMTERPDLLQARLSVEAQGIQLKFDFNQLLPQLNVTGSYGYNGAGAVYNDTFSEISSRNSPFYSWGGELSLPLSNVGARNTYKGDKVTEKQLVLKLKQLEQNIMESIDTAIKTAQSDYESVQATRDARIYAEEALDAEQKTYAVGKATTFEVLTYQNNLTSARGAEIRALANYEEDLANLAQQEGSTLERLGINIEAN